MLFSERGREGRRPARARWRRIDCLGRTYTSLAAKRQTSTAAAAAADSSSDLARRWKLSYPADSTATLEVSVLPCLAVSACHAMIDGQGAAAKAASSQGYRRLNTCFLTQTAQHNTCSSVQQLSHLLRQTIARFKPRTLLYGSAPIDCPTLQGASFSGHKHAIVWKPPLAYLTRQHVKAVAKHVSMWKPPTCLRDIDSTHFLYVVCCEEASSFRGRRKDAWLLVYLFFFWAFDTSTSSPVAHFTQPVRSFCSPVAPRDATSAIPVAMWSFNPSSGPCRLGTCSQLVGRAMISPPGGAGGVPPGTLFPFGPFEPAVDRSRLALRPRVIAPGNTIKAPFGHPPPHVRTGYIVSTS